jgi:hypothetical protein
MKTNCRHPRSVFTPEEDFLLRQLVKRFGENWELVACYLPNRNQRQCKDRWTNYLSPTISTDPWTEEDDQLLLQKVNELGPKWTQFKIFFPHRTDANLKNRWFILIRRARKAGARVSANSESHTVESQLSERENSALSQDIWQWRNELETMDFLWY